MARSSPFLLAISHKRNIRDGFGISLPIMGGLLMSLSLENVMVAQARGLVLSILFIARRRYW
ncbi:hypothetical protein REPUB_Repub07fG0161700 [Reevesia pubescens]